MRADSKGAREERQHHIRMGVRGHIEVRRLASQQQIAHASAYEVGVIAGGAQPRDNLRRRLPGYTLPR